MKTTDHPVHTKKRDSYRGKLCILNAGKNTGLEFDSRRTLVWEHS